MGNADLIRVCISAAPALSCPAARSLSPPRVGHADAARGAIGESYNGRCVLPNSHPKPTAMATAVYG